MAILQRIKFDYLYVLLGIYFALLWLSYILWLWNDLQARFTNSLLRTTLWIIFSITFLFGFFLYLLIRPTKRTEDDFYIELERNYLRFETYGMQPCEKCNFSLRPEFLNCPSCKNKLRGQCKYCEKIIDLKWKHCPFCAKLNDIYLDQENPKNIARKHAVTVINKPKSILHRYKIYIRKMFFGIQNLFDTLTKDNFVSYQEEPIKALNKPLEIRYEEELKNLEEKNKTLLQKEKEYEQNIRDNIDIPAKKENVDGNINQILKNQDTNKIIKSKLGKITKINPKLLKQKGKNI